MIMSAMAEQCNGKDRSSIASSGRHSELWLVGEDVSGPTTWDSIEGSCSYIITPPLLARVVVGSETMREHVE